jgi:hypothetical protein
MTIMTGTAAADAPEKYTKIWLSEFFHSFPHYNFEFNTINSSFNPDSDDYRESAGVCALLPVAICVILWLVFIIYFIVRCCESQTKATPRPSSCTCFWTGLFILVGLGLLGFGFYQNEEAHRDVNDCIRYANDANFTVSTATERVSSLESISKQVSTKLCDDLETALRPLNATLQAKAQKWINHTRIEANSVQGYVEKINIKDSEGSLEDGIKLSESVEYFRWMINILVFCLYIFLLLMAFIGLLLKSRNVLIIAATIAVICSIFIWATTGIYIATSMVLGDFCINPDSYALSLVNGNANEDAFKAYILCTDPTQPYQAIIQDAINSVSLASKDLNEVVKLAAPYSLPGLNASVTEMEKNLDYATGNLSTLLTNVGICTSLHHDYVQALNAACIETSSATAFLALISCLVAITCTFIVFMLSCVWRQFALQRATQRATYIPVDDTDPFLPRPPQYDPDYGTMSSSTPRPWSERGTLQHGSTNPEDQSPLNPSAVNLPPDESPPPAYYPGKFMRQYADSTSAAGGARSYTPHV